VNGIVRSFVVVVVKQSARYSPVAEVIIIFVLLVTFSLDMVGFIVFLISFAAELAREQWIPDCFIQGLIFFFRRSSEG
jgi:hypothetical protein